MAQLLVLHHALGLTRGVRSLARAWEDAGHQVSLPDFYDGHTFTDVASGVDYARSVGFDVISGLGEDAASDLSPGFVVVGMSLGVIPALRIGMGNDAAAAVIAAGSCLDQEFLGGPWPSKLPLRILASEGDSDFINDGDLAAAQALVAAGGDVKLRLLPGNEHLFMEAFDPASVAATDALYELVLRYLSRADEAGPSPDPDDDAPEPWEDELL